MGQSMAYGEKMTRALILSAFLLSAFSLPPAHSRSNKVPYVRTEMENPDPHFEQDPLHEDYFSRLMHFWDCITDQEIPQNRVPGMDFFLGNFEEKARNGIDAPLAEIALNADSAREGLRLSFNDLAKAGSDPRLAKISRELSELAAEFTPMVERNRQSIRELEDLAAQARNTVGSMVHEPPNSPGSRVPLAQLDFLTPLRPELERIRYLIDRFAKRLKKTKTLVKRAKRRTKVIDSLAKRARVLDKRSLDKLGEGRTSGAPRGYTSQMTSEKVVKNAHKRLTDTIAKAEEVMGLIEDQLDPQKDGLRKAVDSLIIADGKTMLGREKQRQAAKRINWNHEMRMNDSIMYGYEAAPDYRREWWLGRSEMAMGESKVDSAKMDAAVRRAKESAQAAEDDTRVAAESIKKIAETLGDFHFKPHTIAKRVLNIPAVRYPKTKKGPKRAKRRVKHRKLKIPKTFNVTDEEVLKSYDGRRAGY